MEHKLEKREKLRNRWIIVVAILAGSLILLLVIGFFQWRRYDRLTRERNALNEQTFIDWFGMEALQFVRENVGAIDDIGKLMNVTESKEVRLALEWQQNGLVGVLGLLDEDVESMRADLVRVVNNRPATITRWNENYAIAADNTETALLLLDGGFPILIQETEDCIFDGERFLRGVLSLSVRLYSHPIGIEDPFTGEPYSDLKMLWLDVIRGIIP